MSRRQLVAPVAIVLVAFGVTLLPPASAAPTDDRNRAYVAGDGLNVTCDGSDGGGCFTLTGREATATVRISDLAGVTGVAGRYRFRDVSGEILAAGAFCDRTTVEVPAGSAGLEVLVPAFDPVICLPAAPSPTATGSIRVVFSTAPGAPVDVDVERQDCLQAAPATAGRSGLTDSGQDVELDVLVLLDGVTRERGVEIMTKAAEAYAPLGITVVSRFRPVSFTSDRDDELIGEARNAVGGEVPKGVDVVLGLTSKQGRGQADCIGGIRFADRAFAVSPDHADKNIDVAAGVQLGRIENRAAMTAAHEIGHLLGAQHHFGNCAEVPDHCTLMTSPSVQPATLVFSTANAAIVRGHAVAYATS